MDRTMVCSHVMSVAPADSAAAKMAGVEVTADRLLPLRVNRGTAA